MVFLFLFLALSGKSNPAHEVEHTPRNDVADQNDLHQLIFLLQYIGRDYQGAVENGKVVDSFEYHEMLEFGETVIRRYADLKAKTGRRSTFTKLQQLQGRIKGKSDFSEIKARTNEIIEELSTTLHIETAPRNRPNLKQGKLLYQANCSPCHGLEGDGKGFAAADLNPAPTEFRNPDYLNEVTPYLFCNAIKFGIDGTAMPSYQQAFTEEDTWDVAFYLMTLRQGFSPQSSAMEIEVSRKDLANKSNNVLIDRYRLQTDPGNEPKSQLLHRIDYLRQNLPRALENVDLP